MPTRLMSRTNSLASHSKELDRLGFLLYTFAEEFSFIFSDRRRLHLACVPGMSSAMNLNSFCNFRKLVHNKSNSTPHPCHGFQRIQLRLNFVLFFYLTKGTGSDNALRTRFPRLSSPPQVVKPN